MHVTIARLINNGERYRNAKRPSKEKTKREYVLKITLLYQDTISAFFSDEDNGFQIKRKKGDTILNVAQRNAVAILNELRPGLVYDTISQTGPEHAPLFKIKVEVDGQEFVGMGGSKKVAKCKAAELALQSFIQFPNNCKVIPTNGLNAGADFTSDSFDANAIKKAVTPDSLDKQRGSKGPTQLFNELYPNTKYECIELEGNIYCRFKMTVNIGGEVFVGTGMFDSNFFGSCLQ